MPTVDDKFRVALKFSLPDAQTAFNIINFAITTGTVDDATLLLAVAAWLATMYGRIDGEMNNGVDIETSQVYEMAYVAGQWAVDRIVGTVTPTFTAADATDMLPHQSAAVITFPTTKSKSRGRIFIPGFTEANQADGVLTAAALVNLSLFAADYLASQVAGTATFRTRLFRTDGTLGVYSGSDLNDVMGTQRRRKIGVGV
jgi:hypothetical protein